MAFTPARDQFSQMMRFWRRNSGRSDAPTQKVMEVLGFAVAKAGLSVNASILSRCACFENLPIKDRPHRLPIQYPTSEPATDERVTVSHSQRTRGVSPMASANIGMYSKSGGIGWRIDSVKESTAKLAGPKISKKSSMDCFHDMTIASYS